MSEDKIICVGCDTEAVCIFETVSGSLGTATCQPCGIIYQRILDHQGTKDLWKMELLEQ